MGDASSSINHDVSVVAILDLNNVAKERVGGHGLNEVDSGLLVANAIGAAVLENEKSLEIVDFRPTHLIP